MENNQNPLVGYFRKPEVYIALPSKGQYYPEGTIDLSPNGEVGVFPMTARDELIFKTPDALLNGTSTVEVIRSCVPAIKDPWAIPSIDMDALLIAIRIATYGSEMPIGSTCPSCMHRNEFEVPLGSLLDQTSQWYFNTKLELDEMILHFKPLNYKDMNVESLRQFEENKIMRIVNDGTMDDEQKQQLFQETFLKLTIHTVDLIGKTICQVDTPNGTTDNPEHITEFVRNADRKTFNAIQEFLEKQKEHSSFREFTAQCEECSTEYNTPILFDNANFFG